MEKGFSTSSTKSTTAWAEVDQEGRIILPASVKSRYGLAPGSRIRLDEGLNFIRMHRPVTQLTKIYIEPTVACNLDCITCFRNCWDQPLGRMSDETFDHFFTELKDLDPIPNVYFGGIGEPLFHPKTVEWIARVKSLGVNVELITNGTILTENISRKLIEAGLDILWVSIDGATPETYADVRLGAELPTIINNLKRFAELRPANHFPKPEIGIAFVAMKRNIADLPKVIQLGKSVKAKYYSVSNVQPATEDMQDDRLYVQTMHNIAYLQAPHLPRLSLPRMDFDQDYKRCAFPDFQQPVEC